MTTVISGSYPAINSDSDATVNGLTVGKGGGAVASNTAVGVNALAANTTGNQSVAVGTSALAAQTGGYDNVAIGVDSLAQTTTGVNNSAIGTRSLWSNTTGQANTGLGRNALRLNTTGSYNTAQGVDALYSNTTADNNTAVGYQAGYANTTGTRNVIIGKGALSQNTTGSYNVALGYEALPSNTTPNYNTAVGYQAGYSITTGAQNTFVGLQAGYAITTGSKNTVLGAYNGNQGGLDIRTASNFAVISDGDGNPLIVSTFTGSIFSTHFGIAASSYGGNAVIVPTYSGNQQPAIRSYDTDSVSRTNNFIDIRRNGTTVGTITTTLSATAYNTSSDYRLKENIAPMTGALEKVSQLKPVTYTWKADGSAGQGFIAHELQEVCADAVTGEKDAVNEDGSIKPQGIDTSFLVATLTAAIQELNAKVEAQAAEIAALKGANNG